MWLWPLKVPTQNFLVLLVLVLRNMLTTVWSRFRSRGLVEILNLNFGHNIEAEVWSRLWSVFSVKTLKLKFGQDLVADIWLSFWAKAWSRLWSWILINLRYDWKAITLVRALNPWVGCAFGDVYLLSSLKENTDNWPIVGKYCWKYCWRKIMITDLLLSHSRGRK